MAALILAALAGPVDHGVGPLPAPAWPDYAAATRTAKAEAKPLVTFVGVTPRGVPGCVACIEPALAPFKRGDVVVSLFVGGRHEGVVTDGTPAAVGRALATLAALKPAPPAPPAPQVTSPFSLFPTAPACVGPT